MTEPTQSCPECAVILGSMPLASGSALACRSCAGVSINFAVLRQHAPDPVVRDLWAGVRGASRESLRLCPSCKHALRAFVLDSDDPVELDGCARCMLIWFDGRELEHVGVTLSPRSMNADSAGHGKALMDSQALHDNAKFESAADFVRFLMAEVYWWIERW